MKRLALVSILCVLLISVAGYGQTLEENLRIAAKEGDIETVKTLLAKGANIEAKDNLGFTALIYAALYKRIPIIQALLAKGANIEAKNNNGFTALMTVALSGQVAAIQTLLAKGANIEAKGNYGHTALMIAADEGQVAITQLLLAKGADIEAKNSDGFTALNLAKSKNQIEIVKILEAKMNKPCSASSTTEHLFRLNGYAQTGVVIKRGDKLTFEASGTVFLGIMAGSGGPEGINGFRGYNLVQGDGQHGALIARINKTDGWYIIGRGKTIVADVEGILELAVNDNDPGNNRGQFNVQVSVCKSSQARKPQPQTRKRK